MIGPVVTAAESTGGETTGWTVLGTLVAGLLALAGEYARRQRKNDATPTATTETPAPVPATPEGKLDAAKELFFELRSARDKAITDLETFKQVHDRQVADLQDQLRRQDIYIGRLERLLDVPPTPEGPTQPTRPAR